MRKSDYLSKCRRCFSTRGVPHVRLMGVGQCVNIPRRRTATMPMDYSTLDRAFAITTGSGHQQVRRKPELKAGKRWVELVY